MLMLLTLLGSYCDGEVLIFEGGGWDSSIEGDQPRQVSFDCCRNLTLAGENHHQVHILTQLDLKGGMEREVSRNATVAYRPLHFIV